MIEGSWVRILVEPLRNFGNSVYSTLPEYFRGKTESRRSLLSGVYARGSKISHTGDECVTCRGLHNSEINQSCVSPRIGCLEYTYPRLFAGVAVIATCVCLQHNIHSYPTTILYNDSTPHQFRGQHDMRSLLSFIEVRHKCAC